MSTFKELQEYTKRCSHQYMDVVMGIIDNMSDDEYDKIPTLQMSETERQLIEAQGHVWGFYDKDNLYSVGVTPFKIKVK